MADNKLYFLKKHVKDPRDFSFSRTFGSVIPEQLPADDFYVAEPLEIMNQDINYNSDFCPAYATSAAREYECGIPFVPEWTFAKAKQLIAEAQGATPEVITQILAEFGLSLRDIMMAAVYKGFLPREFDPFHCDTQDRPARDYVADYRNWPADLDPVGYEYATPSFFEVDGPGDIFTNFRSTLWLNRAEKRAVVSGALWRQAWTKAPGGFVDVDTYNPNDPSDPGSAHAFEFFGQMVANEKLWLVAQLSDGANFGDKGLFYFSQEVVNREFGAYGAYTMSNMPKTQAKYLNANGISVNSPLIDRILAVVWNALLALISRLKI